MKPSNRNVTVLACTAGLIVGATIGLTAYVSSEAGKPAVYTTLCVAGQNRVIESNKTREFHVMWDETCPK